MPVSSKPHPVASILPDPILPYSKSIYLLCTEPSRAIKQHQAQVHGIAIWNPYTVSTCIEVVQPGHLFHPGSLLVKLACFALPACLLCLPAMQAACFPHHVTISSLTARRGRRMDAQRDPVAEDAL
jgi:hypothetical protein